MRLRGRSIDGCELKVVDERANELPTASREIAIRSVSLSKGTGISRERPPSPEDGCISAGLRRRYDGSITSRKEKDIIIVAGKTSLPRTWRTR